MFVRATWMVAVGVVVASWSAHAGAQQRAAIVADVAPEHAAAATAAVRTALAASGIEIVPDGELHAARQMVFGDAAAPLDDAAVTRLRAEMGIAFVARVQVQPSGEALAVAVTWITAEGASRRFASATSAELSEMIARLTGEIVRAGAQVTPRPIIVPVVPPAAAPAVVAAPPVDPGSLASETVVQVLSEGAPHEVTLTSGTEVWTCSAAPCQLRVPSGAVLVTGRGYRAELMLPPGLATIETRAGSEVSNIVLGAIGTGVGAIAVSIGLALWVPAETYRGITDRITDEFYPGLALWVIGGTLMLLSVIALVESLATLRGRARVMPPSQQRVQRAPQGPTFALGAGSAALQLQW